MSPWDALAKPLFQRPGHAYTESVARQRPLSAKARPPTSRTKPKAMAPAFAAAAILWDGQRWRLIPITVVDFYAAKD